MSINPSRPDIWACEKLRDEMIPPIEEARTGGYAEKIIRLLEEGQTDRGTRVAELTRELRRARHGHRARREQQAQAVTASRNAS